MAARCHAPFSPAILAGSAYFLRQPKAEFPEDVDPSAGPIGMALPPGGKDKYLNLCITQRSGYIEYTEQAVAVNGLVYIVHEIPHLYYNPKAWTCKSIGKQAAGIFFKWSASLSLSSRNISLYSCRLFVQGWSRSY